MVEIVGDDANGRIRNYEHKMIDYAVAGISEYWIVDPRERRIKVLKLVDGSYQTHGEFAPGARADSAMLAGLVVDVGAVFAAGDDVLQFGE